VTDETSPRRQGAGDGSESIAERLTRRGAHPPDTLSSAALSGHHSAPDCWGRDWQARLLGEGPWTPIDDEQAEHLYGWDLRWRPVGAWREISGSVVADLGVEAALVEQDGAAT
jgi:hypothetical protein